MGLVIGPELVSTRQQVRAAHATGQLLSSALPDWWTAALGALLRCAPETVASCSVLGNVECRVPAAQAAAASVLWVPFGQSCASGDYEPVVEGSVQSRPSSGCWRVGFTSSQHVLLHRHCASQGAPPTAPDPAGSSQAPIGSSAAARCCRAHAGFREVASHPGS